MKPDSKDYSKITQGYFDQIYINIKKGIYKPLGKGTARIVYDLGNGTVVKAAKNAKGLAQNEVEYWIAMDDESGIFAHVLAASEGYRFLIVDKASEIKDMSDVYDYYEVRSSKELIQKLRKVCSKYNLMLWDLSRPVNWGKIDGKPVIIDYGFTKQVRKRFYRAPFAVPKRNISR